MTAMRVMQSDIESKLSSLGSQTFVVRKWPGLFFGGDGYDWEKYWRRKNITPDQGRRLQERATLPLNIGMEAVFWAGEIQTRYNEARPMSGCSARRPAVFPRTTGTCKRPAAGGRRCGRRAPGLRARSGLATTFSRTAPRSASS